MGVSAGAKAPALTGRKAERTKNPARGASASKRGENWRKAIQRPKPVRVYCEVCKKVSGVKLSYRLNSANWHPEYKRLCTPCRARLGYYVVTHARTNLRWTESQ